MKRRRWALVFASGVLIGMTGAAQQAQATGLPLVQMNVSGAAFGQQVLPGKVGYNYFFPTADNLGQWHLRGIKVIRFPILWERLQPRLNERFDPEYAALIDTFLQETAAKGMTAILDVHNYGMYREQVLGSANVPLTAYRDLLRRIAGRWHTSAGLHGYDLMNEPHDGADADWPKAAQAGIDGVRSVDRKHPIYVEGRAWSSALKWASLNDDLLELKDPADKLIFSAHLYLDSDSSGRYQSGPGLLFDPEVGVTRSKPFVEWLIRNGKHGHIGEFGFPANDPRWHSAAVLLLNYLKKHCVPLAYWAAGPLWGDYPLSVEPTVGVDKPQWRTIKPYVNSAGCDAKY